MLKKVPLLLCLILICINITKTKALSLEKGNCINEDNIIRIENNNFYFNNICIIKNTTNNKILYNLSPIPNRIVQSDYTYIQDNNNLNLEEETLKKINLYAYFGYGYKNHTDLKWYSITQYLIYKEIDKEEPFYATVNTADKITKYEKEIQELTTLVEQYLKEEKTSIYTKDINTTLIIPKNNYVLINPDTYIKEIKDTYEISIPEKDLEYNLQKGNPDYFQILKSTTNTKSYFLENTNLPYTKKTIKIKSIYASIKLNIESNKDNKTTIDNNTIYTLYDKNQKKIRQITIDTLDTINISGLKKDIYYLKMTSNSFNVLKEDSVYTIDLINNDFYTKNIKINYIKIPVQLHLQNEEKENIKDITISFLKEKEKISAKTNSNGIINLSLEPGIYTVTQEDTKKNYDEFKTFTIQIFPDTKELTLTKINYLKKYNLEVYTNLDTTVCIDTTNCQKTKNGYTKFILPTGNHELSALPLANYNLDVSSISLSLTKNDTACFMYLKQNPTKEDTIYIPDTSANINYFYPLTLGVILAYKLKKKM